MTTPGGNSMRRSRDSGVWQHRSTICRSCSGGSTGRPKTRWSPSCARTGPNASPTSPAAQEYWRPGSPTNCAGEGIRGRHVRRHAGQAKARSGAVTWLKGPAEQLPFEDGSLDAVVTIGLPLLRPARGHAEFHRVLAPGGLVAVATISPPPAKLPCTGWRRRTPASPTARHLPRCAGCSPTPGSPSPASGGSTGRCGRGGLGPHHHRHHREG